MYEINITVAPRFYGWNDDAEIKLKDSVREWSDCIEFSDGLDGRRVYIRFDDAEKAETALTRFLTEFYCVSAKRGYLASKLKLPMISELSKAALIHTLIAFDRDRDEEAIKDELSFGETFSIDGFYNFRLRSIERRWNEIIGLTADNYPLMYDENALDLLIKFLLSTVAPRFDSVVLCENGGCFELETFDGDIISVKEPGDLIAALIDIAPMEIILKDELSNAAFKKRLSDMFDVKSEVNSLAFSEKISRNDAQTR